MNETEREQVLHSDTSSSTFFESILTEDGIEVETSTKSLSFTISNHNVLITESTKRVENARKKLHLLRKKKVTRL